MNKFLFISLLALCFLVHYYRTVAEYQEKMKDTYKNNNTILLTKIRKVYDDKVATDSKIKELEARAKEDMAFDWYLDISSSPVVLELKK